MKPYLNRLGSHLILVLKEFRLFYNFACFSHSSETCDLGDFVHLPQIFVKLHKNTAAQKREKCIGMKTLV